MIRAVTQSIKLKSLRCQIAVMDSTDAETGFSTTSVRRTRRKPFQVTTRVIATRPVIGRSVPLSSTKLQLRKSSITKETTNVYPSQSFSPIALLSTNKRSFTRSSRSTRLASTSLHRLAFSAGKIGWFATPSHLKAPLSGTLLTISRHYQKYIFQSPIPFQASEKF